MERLDVTVYRTETEIIIVGDPEEDDEMHNCDAMGCNSLEHVLYRFNLPVMVTSTEEAAKRVYAKFIQKLAARYPDSPWVKGGTTP